MKGKAIQSQIIELKGERLVLHPERLAYWEGEKTLLVADLHIGKVGHFRKSGIAVPAEAGEGNFRRLEAMIRLFNPDRVLFLGDLFHSFRNREVDRFAAWMQGFAAISFCLVRGNHDILGAAAYEEMGLEVHRKPLLEGPFIFSHEPLEKVEVGTFNLAGHIHPGVILEGAGQQRMRLPCFYFSPVSGLLPAFGDFTGLAPIRPREGDLVFPIAGKRVLAFGRE